MRAALCFVCAFAFVFAFGATSAHASVVGKYSIDKKRMLTEMKASIAKLPERRRAFARMALAMLKSMKLDMQLQKRGKASVVMFMKVFGKSKTKKGSGSWRTMKAKNKQGSTIIRIETVSVDKKGNKQTDKLNCTAQKNGGLACVNVNKGGKKRKTFYFHKVTSKK